jgi:hypothetical protein
MRAIIIDDHAEDKIHDKDLRGIRGIDLTVALSVKDGIEHLDTQPQYEHLYLDGNFDNGGSGVDVLMWLSNHMDKVPEKITIVSYMSSPVLKLMADSLLHSARRLSIKVNGQL